MSQKQQLTLSLGLISIAVILVSGEPSCEWSSSSSSSSSSHGSGAIIDITHSLREGLPVWEGINLGGLGKVVTQVESIANGSMANVSEMKMGVHTGTHVDSPSHFLEEAYLAGVDTSNGLDLASLNGPVLIVEVPRGSNITENVVQRLVPAGVQRVLFRTLNTDRRLMWQANFVTDYTAITGDGAEWIAAKTGLRLVGVDYLSAASYDALAEAHKALFSKGVVLLEGLNLDHAEPGVYELHCLPVRLVGSDGAPTRCILVT